MTLLNGCNCLSRGLFVALFSCNQVTEEIFLSVYSAAVLRQDVVKCNRAVCIVFFQVCADIYSNVSSSLGYHVASVACKKVPRRNKFFFGVSEK